MLLPIYFALWALLFAPSHSMAVDTVQKPSAFPQKVESDTAVLKHLQQKLKKHLSASAPEKIYLHLDRSFFQPGETVWFNAYLRNAGDLGPSLQSQILYVELLNANGSVLATKEMLALDGTAAGEFDLSAGLPGGLYKIKAYTQWMLNTEEAFEREITLQKVIFPNVNLKLEFERKAFGAGDIAIAKFDAQSLDNKPIANQKIRYQASIEGKSFIEAEALTDANGRAYLRFQLPEKIKAADGLLNVLLEHHGQQEAISRAIPIVLNQLDLQFFPEGGEAVAGLPCVMAFKALNEFGKPADVEGVILDKAGNEVCKFSSFHDGMGAFTFTPEQGEQYTAQLIKPFFSEQPYKLPKAKNAGVALQILENTPKNLKLSLAGKNNGKVYLVGNQRDKIFFFKAINLKSDSEQINIPTADLSMGIARLTVLDVGKTEIAERLVFVGKDKGLHIDLTTDKQEYLPRETVNMKIQVRDHAGQPVQGHFSLAVADEKLLSFADDKQGNILASLLLEQDVKGRIENPNFYFDATESKSEKALDYLLLTQGWRRFTLEEVLNKSPLVPKYAAERAILEGQLWRRDGKPIRGGIVTLYPNGPSVQSNREGYFSFQNIDLSIYSHLQYGNGQYYAIQGYGSDILLQMPMRLNQGNFKISTTPSGTGSTVLTGNISDGTEGLIGGTVKVTRGPEFIRGTITDYNGDYRIQLDPGVYDVEFSYTGFQAERITNVGITAGSMNHLDLTMKNSTNLDAVYIIAYKIPLIEQDQTSSGQTLTSEQIKNIPTRGVNAIVATTVGASSIDGGDVNIRGARSNGTDYYIDGIRVSGRVPPVQDLDQLQVITSGLGAEFGNLTGGTVSANSITKGPAGRNSSRYRYASVRQFHKAREFYTPKYESEPSYTTKTDFRSTIYWSPNITTDKSGKAEVQFVCSDAITNFRATLEGIDKQGNIGHSEQKFFVQKPLSIAVKTPFSVIVGDVLNLQIALSNKTNAAMGGHLVLALPEHFIPNNAKSAFIPESIHLSPGETQIIEVAYKIGQPKNKNQSISVKFWADENLMDAFETNIQTYDRGFPTTTLASGSAAQNLLNIHLIDPVEGTLKASLTAYPSPLADILKGMERMLRQPSGCFEQVSSSNYPNLLVLELLRSTGSIHPDVESRAMNYLEDGYKKLIAYECKSGGFEWFGRDPGHEGLTAYGLLEFTDMAKVMTVDKSMLDRTVQWLLSQRDGKGGWKLNPQSLHGWQNDEVLVAYLAWAVAEAGYGKQFKAEIESAVTLANQSADPHILALMANALAVMDDPRAESLTVKLANMQTPEGFWKGASHSAFRSQGVALDIETTALAALAFFKTGTQPTKIRQAIAFLAKSKTAYGYGNTQSTVLALRAMVEYAKSTQNQEGGQGTMIVQIDGKHVESQAFFSEQSNQLEISGLEKYFANNDPQIEVFFEGENAAIPFDLEIKYASRTPQDAPNCPISLKTALETSMLSIGETVRLTTLLKNETEQVQASPLVVLGIPAGLSLQPWQLKKLVDEHQCDFYELWDGYAVFHFKHLDPNESRQLSLDLRAEVAGVFEAPASKAYLYYQNEQRVWSRPEKVEIRR